LVLEIVGGIQHFIGLPIKPPKPNGVTLRPLNVREKRVAVIAIMANLTKNVAGGEQQYCRKNEFVHKNMVGDKIRRMDFSQNTLP
jgi:hypothetical protein